jgi:hypothetical protein
MATSVAPPVRTEPPAPRRFRGRILPWAALAVLLVGLAIWGVSVSDGERDVPVPAAGTVQVTVRGLEGALGGQVAGGLIPGWTDDLLYPTTVGGFVVDVDADPFTTTQPIREPGDEDEGAFPDVGNDPLAVEPGVYTLSIWWRPDAPLLPYNRWVPAGQDGLGGCEAMIEVPEGGGVAVTITGDFTKVLDGSIPSCAVE